MNNCKSQNVVFNCSFCCLGRTQVDETLFIYAGNESHAVFNNDSSYTPVFAVDPDRVSDSAKAACGNNRECLFDFAQTQDMDFAMSTMSEVEDQEELKKILSKLHCTDL